MKAPENPPAFPLVYESRTIPGFCSIHKCSWCEQHGRETWFNERGQIATGAWLDEIKRNQRGPVTYGICCDCMMETLSAATESTPIITVAGWACPVCAEPFVTQRKGRITSVWCNGGKCRSVLREVPCDNASNPALTVDDLAKKLWAMIDGGPLRSRE